MLVVEDEPMVRKMLTAMLKRLNFEVLAAENGLQALEVLARTSEPPAAILLDLTMPVMGGRELLPILHARYPGLKVIATSGYTESEAQDALHEPGVAGVLQKPYKSDALKETLRSALG